MAKVLVVEDDPMIQMLIRETLRSGGHQAITVSDGLAALPAAQEHRPALVLLDIGLPGIDGFEVLERLKADEELKSVPVVMVTAWGEPELMTRALETGAIDYVRKPFTVGDLLARVSAVLGGTSGPGASAPGSSRTVRVDVDLDEVADVHGSAAADAVLEAVRARAAHEAGPAGSARVEGAAVLVTSADEEPEQLAERLRLALSSPIAAAGAIIRVRTTVAPA